MSEVKWDKNQCEGCLESQSAIVGLTGIIREKDKIIERQNVVEWRAWELVTHPAFNSGTGMYEKLPKGIVARAEHLKEALVKNKQENKGKNG